MGGVVFAGVLDSEKQGGFAGVEAGPGELAFHRAGGKEQRFAARRPRGGKDPAGVVAEHIGAAVHRGPIGHHPDIAGAVDRQVVRVGEAHAPLPGCTTGGRHAPAKRSTRLLRPGGGILQAHQPAVGPAALAGRPPEDGGIGLALPVRAAGGEGDQQIARAWVEVGVLRPCRGGGPCCVGGQVGIDQDRPELFLPSAWVEIGQGAEALAVGLELGIALHQLGAGLAAVAVGQRQHRAQIKTGEMGGGQGVERRLRLQRDPLATAVRLEARHLQPATLEQA